MSGSCSVALVLLLLVLPDALQARADRESWRATSHPVRADDPRATVVVAHNRDVVDDRLMERFDSVDVAGAGSVIERRRTFGALVAAGTPVGVLSRALRREAMLPILVAALGAGLTGIVVGVGLLTVVDDQLVLTHWVAVPFAMGPVVALLAAVACGPVLRRVTIRDHFDG